MNAIEITALVVSVASIFAGLAAAIYLFVWLKRHGAQMMRGEWPASIMKPLMAATVILGVPVVRGVCAMIYAWQQGLK